jgi:hypothetical protein
MKIAIFLLLGLFVLTGCQEELIEENVKIQGIELIAEAPIFEGSNTFTGDYDFMIDDAKKSKLKQVVINTITCEITEKDSGMVFQDIALQINAKSLGMTKIGVLNPIPSEKNVFELKPASDLENLVQFIQGQSVTWVADINVDKDGESNLGIKISIDATFKFLK